jgi:glucose-1-phosphate thymidylyltransferase
MKGVILAGGLGTRLRPLTLITNKHLLPVYDKPMILYPLETLKRSGISDVTIVCGKEHAGHFMNFLGSGAHYDVQLSYALQDASGGIAEALGLARVSVGNEKMAVILGDNVFENDFSESIKAFNGLSGAMVFLKRVSDPGRFGIAELEDGKIKKIVEKPKTSVSDMATVGFYLYDADVFDKISRLVPSERGELEITDVHNMYLREGRLHHDVVDGFWSDAGTFESLFSTARWVEEKKRTSI